MNFHLKTIFSLAVLLFLCSCSETTNKVKSEQARPSLDEMIGQMIMFGFRGLDIGAVNDSVKQHIKAGRVGGIILFDYDVIRKEAKRNIASPEQLKNLIGGINSISTSKLLIAIDQEGGRVNRLKSKYGFPSSVSNKYLGTLNKLDSTRYYARRNAETLAEMGFNVNFAPNVDLEINPDNPVIGRVERSYSAEVEVVVNHASVWIDEHREKGIISTLKHFPGHGSSDSDSHYGVTDITNYWKPIELEPFKVLASKEQVAIMTAHVVNKNLDTLPATLSKKIIKKIIREEWKFDGLLFSDDLQMAAVNAIYDFDTIVQLSIEAGVDILVFGNNLKYDISVPTKVNTTIKKLISEGKLTRERIEDSYLRIIEAKSKI